MREHLAFRNGRWVWAAALLSATRGYQMWAGCPNLRNGHRGLCLAMLCGWEGGMAQCRLSAWSDWHVAKC